MSKDSKGHGSNAHEMRKLDAMPWSKLTAEQQGQLRAHKQAMSEKAPSLYSGAPSSVTRRKETQNAAGLKALGKTIKVTSSRKFTP